jgi:hypothetical protein
MPEIDQLKYRNDLFWLTVWKISDLTDCPTCFGLGEEGLFMSWLGMKERKREGLDLANPSQGVPPWSKTSP